MRRWRETILSIAALGRCLSGRRTDRCSCPAMCKCRVETAILHSSSLNSTIPAEAPSNTSTWNPTHRTTLVQYMDQVYMEGRLMLLWKLVKGGIQKWVRLMIRWTCITVWERALCEFNGRFDGGGRHARWREGRSSTLAPAGLEHLSRTRLRPLCSCTAASKFLERPPLWTLRANRHRTGPPTTFLLTRVLYALQLRSKQNFVNLQVPVPCPFLIQESRVGEFSNHYVIS